MIEDEVRVVLCAAINLGFSALDGHTLANVRMSYPDGATEGARVVAKWQPGQRWSIGVYDEGDWPVEGWSGKCDGGPAFVAAMEEGLRICGGVR